ncbi:helix-turn-helix domain-containing protein [Croceivirga radicis]|uniref:helix-turn-helix domain-containing protein n=1 Tax=Croceivirga radicis TaxID=1929488 RepID=UPI000255AE22|nr:AraC family transcriptional regulator [Croceivirga radicis]
MGKKEKMQFKGTNAPQFLLKKFEENGTQLDFIGENGIQKRYQLNGCVLLGLYYQPKEQLRLQLVQEQKALKFVFQVSGSNQLQFNKKVVAVEEGFYNLIVNPAGNLSVNAAGKTIACYILTIQLAFIAHLFEDDNELLSSLNKLYMSNELTTYWKENKPFDAAICNVLNDFDTVTLEGDLKKAYLQTKTVELLRLLFHKNEKKQRPIITARPPKQLDTLMAKVNAYLAYNLHRSVTIPELAQFAGINTTKLKTDFKKVYGKTIFKQLTTLRMQKAYGLLLAKELSIAQISQQVGYKNPQHFTVAFKKFYGHLPSEIS